KNIVLLTEINGFFDASLLHNYMDVIKWSLLIFIFVYGTDIVLNNFYKCFDAYQLIQPAIHFKYNFSIRQ
ncbi:hypothetical protein, partial [Enterococcus faecium]|uniref:hypothetical protein n=1 Tax=Enterococcus faecium TaxID=1352 RepID=UPI00309C17BC